ncbi:hypothetical protein ACP275_04G111100 [Erythranthe tilingii]
MKKARRTDDELQEARKELMTGFNDIRSVHFANIGIKKIGEINEKVFKDTLIKRLPSEEAEVEARKLCCLWQEKIKHTESGLFRIGDDNRLVINEDDELLRNLKNEWGDEIYAAVTTAWLELEEYNPSGYDVVSDLWNFKENRSATLKEGVSYIFTPLKTLKRKREIEHDSLPCAMGK